MKTIKNCIVENCIPTPSSCVEWNGGDIEYLGICNGDSLNNLVWEVVNKIKAIAGEDISQFDIDGLLDICGQKAPQEVTLISILTLIRENQICLKDFIDTLNDKLTELFQDSDIDVNLRCYAELDNMGNALQITRAELDQLIIDNLCAQQSRIDTLEGKVTGLQSQINNLENNTTVDELNFATCVDATVKPTSSQVITLATAHCDLETATGSPAHIASALAKTSADFNTEFGLIAGWDLTPSDWAENYGNLLLAFNNLLSRVKFMEENCCALTCKDVELGFTAIFNEDRDGIIIKFTSGAGTYIPSGFEDEGSEGTIKDMDGNVETFTLEIANNYEVEVPISGLNLNGDLLINITAVLGTGTLTCQKCLSKTVKSSTCGYCEITATGSDGSSAVIIYDDAESVGTVITTPTTSTTTTTTASVTTTTTGAP